jgi:protein-tyrosine phosphatase
MEDMEPFVDIHCHMLPGLDDGPADLDTSLRMAEMAVEDGIATVVATPHQLGNFSQNRGATIRSRTAWFQRTLDARGIPLQILPGADVRIEPELVHKVRSGEVASLADRKRYVLLELPHEVYVPLDRLLTELAAAGMVGVLSHPERNLGILGEPAVVPRLVDRGCLMQVTAGSLLGGFGNRIRRFSEALIMDGLVHFLATDAHGTRSRPPCMREAFDRVAKLRGRDTAAALCCRNPNGVAQGGTVPCGRSAPVATRWTTWLCHRFAEARHRLRAMDVSK